MESNSFFQKYQQSIYLIVIILLLGVILYDKVASMWGGENILSPPYTIGLQPPPKPTFCGEEVPMYEPDVYEKLDREMHINAYWHSHMSLVMKRSHKWFPIIEKILKEEGIPDDFKYIAAIESGLENVVSHAGATGFWQIMPQTGREYGLEITEEVDERYDPIKSTYAACKYIKNSYKKFTNWTAVAASYNMGMGGMNHSLKKQKTASYYDLELNRETARYVYRALAFKEIMENPKKYHFNTPDEARYKPEKMQSFMIDTVVTNLVDLANQLQVSYKTLRYYNPWLRQQRLNIAKGKRYYIQLPINPPKPHYKMQGWEYMDTIPREMLSPYAENKNDSISIDTTHH